MRLVIGTRGSALALWQARHVATRLEEAEPGLRVELQVIKTKGDKILDIPLAQVGGKALFVKEIEEALLRGDIDLAVHSMKDVPAELLEGTELVAISRREDPRDALVSRHPGGLDGLPRGAHVGTASVRRACLLRSVRPDLQVSPLRGNVDTRLRKLDEGELDAIVLAAAGLVRLGRADRISEHLPVDRFLPAIGQGVLALEARAGDDATRTRVRAAIHDDEVAACVAAERALLAALEGGCQTPIAGHAVADGEDLELHAMVGEVDGSTILREVGRADRDDADALGRVVAASLLARGARDLLARGRTDELVGGE